MKKLSRSLITRNSCGQKFTIRGCILKNQGLLLIVFMVVISLFICTSCHSVKGNADEEGHIKIILNYDLEKVYSTTKFILMNSEDRWIRNYSHYPGEIDYAEAENAIFLSVSDRRDVEIYFIPSGKQSMKVTFVITQLLQAKMAGKRLIEELQYYLENGEEAYMKYTKNEALKRRVRGFQ
jgi:predicted metal-binding protein